MVGRTGIKKDSEKANINKKCKGEEIVERYDCSRPEETRYI